MTHLHFETRSNLIRYMCLSRCFHDAIVVLSIVWFSALFGQTSKFDAPSAVVQSLVDGNEPSSVDSSEVPSGGIEESKLLEEGQKYALSAQWLRSVEVYSRALDAMPNSHQALYERATAYYALGEVIKARADLVMLSELQSGKSLDCFYRGDAFDLLDMPEKAKPLYQLAAASQAKGTYELMLRSNAHFQLEEYVLALSDIDAAIKSHPESCVLMSSRGCIYARGRRYDLAIKDFEKAITIKPDYELALNNRGFTYYAMKQYDLSMRDYNEAIRISPKVPMFYDYRANLYRRLKEYEKALKDYDKAIELEPRYFFFVDRATAYRNMGDNDHAIRDFGEAISRNPMRSDAFAGRGSIYFSMSDYDSALKDFSKAIELNSTDAQYFVMRANIYRRLDRNDDADKDAAIAKTLQVR